MHADKFIILAIFLTVILMEGVFALRNPNEIHDAMVFFAGSGTTALGCLCGLVKGSGITKQENQITNSDVHQDTK